MRDVLLALIMAPFWLLLAPLTVVIASGVWFVFRLFPSMERRWDPVEG